VFLSDCSERFDIVVPVTASSKYDLTGVELRNASKKARSRPSEQFLYAALLRRAKCVKLQEGY